MASIGDMNLRLHHVGMLVENIEKESQVYQNRFGYETKSDVVHDPAQTALVQFFKLAQDDVYLEFVAPDGPESKLSNALHKGIRLHHLCYSTDCLEQSCAELRSKGMTQIQAPQNAVAFPGRRIAWLIGRDRLLIELVEQGTDRDRP